MSLLDQRVCLYFLVIVLLIEYFLKIFDSPEAKDHYLQGYVKTGELAMNIRVATKINVPPKTVWAAVSDIQRRSEMLSGIVTLSVLYPVSITLSGGRQLSWPVWR